MASNTNRESAEKREDKRPRMDRWLKQAFPTLTKRQIEESLEEALVCRPGGKPIHKGERLNPSEFVPDVSRLEQHLGKLGRGNPSLTIPIVDEGPDYWLIDKPPSVASQPLSLFDQNTVTHWAFAQYPKLKEEFPEIQPTLTPHRLDGGTSGLLIVAKTRASFVEWRDRFTKKKVRKRYLAWCWGTPRQSFYEVDTPIAHHPKSKRKMVPLTTYHLPPVLEARSFVRVLERKEAEGRFLCEVSCQTGVTHQVRVHLAHLGFPLIGDALYDPEFLERKIPTSHHWLRAIELCFDDEKWVADREAFLKLELSAFKPNT